MSFCRLVLSTAVLLFAQLSYAQAEVVRDAHTEVELVSATRTARPGDEVLVAVRFKTDPDWHIYWKNPGDSGLKTEIRWELPPSVTAGEIRWPYPHPIRLGSLVSYGYEKETLLVVPIRVPASAEPGTSLTLNAEVRWLACEVQCVPGKASLSLVLPVGAASESNPDWAKAFTEVRSEWPIDSADWKVNASTENGRLKIFIASASGEAITSARFFPDSAELIDHAAKQIFSKTSSGYTLEMPLSSVGSGTVGRVTGILTAEPGWRGPGSEKALTIDTTNQTEAPFSLVTALFFAFVGGLILNLMPCVLPVLSLKILHFVKEAGDDPKKLFAHGLSFTAGVIASFWILAGALVALKSAGHRIGWGFQLQSPAFVVVLSFVFFLFALNLFGVFEVGASLGGSGQSLTRKRGFAGSFFSGMFATVVATPCTAPFMGAALGFTLVQPAWVSFAVFTSLGLGMALPYAVLCSNPAFLKFVPKPGLWMETLKQALGFPLLATVIWLAWVLGIQRGLDSVIGLLAGLIAAGLGAWLLGRSRKAAGKTAAFLFLAIGISAALWIPIQSGPAPAPGVSTGAVAWEPYSDARLAELRASGRPVFIDFTAAWCLTCQVNERVALANPEVVAAFREKNIAPLKADWTSQDPAITKALERFGRNSIPFYVYYPAGASQPRVLPELLTPALVLKEIRHED